MTCLSVTMYSMRDCHTIGSLHAAVATNAHHAANESMPPTRAPTASDATIAKSTLTNASAPADAASTRYIVGVRSTAGLPVQMMLSLKSESRATCSYLEGAAAPCPCPERTSERSLYRQRRTKCAKVWDLFLAVSSVGIGSAAFRLRGPRAWRVFRERVAQVAKRHARGGRGLGIEARRRHARDRVHLEQRHVVIGHDEIGA